MGKSLGKSTSIFSDIIFNKVFSQKVMPCKDHECLNHFLALKINCLMISR